MANVADTFALAGLLIALPGALVLWFGTWLWPAELAAALALATLVMLTGALHEDGLADCADAFFGARDRVRRLEIMKDSRIGTFGALALIIQFALGWAALSALVTSNGIIAAVAALLAAAMTSRAAIVWHWNVLPMARPDGLAASQGRPTWQAVRVAAVIAGVGGLVLLLPFFGFARSIVTLGLAAAAALAAMVLARAKIGGQTGDTLGLTQKLVETTLLLVLASN